MHMNIVQFKVFKKCLEITQACSASVSVDTAVIDSIQFIWLTCVSVIDTKLDSYGR